MSEMIERVAEAIAISGNGGTWDDWYNEDQREFHRKRARTAIEAMREPTRSMLLDGANADDCDCGIIGKQAALEAWQAMVDAALK